MNISIRNATAADVPAMRRFIFEHGVNEWNFLPEDDVSAHLADIATGGTLAVLAEEDGRLAGFVTFMRARTMMRYQSRERLGYQHGYICEAVVHRDMAGKGVGSALLNAAIKQLTTQGFEEIYIERHEQNLASAGMMRKAGFVEVATVDDPQRRFSGSRRTTVCRLIAA